MLVHTLCSGALDVLFATHHETDTVHMNVVLCRFCFCYCEQCTK